MKRQNADLILLSFLLLKRLHLCKTERKKMKKELENSADVERLVNNFYQKVRQDSLLSPVFATRIPDEAWPAHLQRMYAFWNAVLFAERGFEGNPMQKHLSLPIDASHFTQWLTLFHQVVDENFTGAKATEAKQGASSIAQIISHKIATSGIKT